jgi:hypothetical protein
LDDLVASVEFSSAATSQNDEPYPTAAAIDALSAASAAPAALSYKDFADALGCHPDYIYILWAKGMPNDSIAAAEAWKIKRKHDKKGKLFF